MVLRWCMIHLLFGVGLMDTQKPNIIVIMADDLGFNDVGFHGSDEIPTPNIDALAYNGVILNTHYTQALCTPSRAAFLTGKYPIHTGMQHLVVLEMEPWGLPLNETIMPQLLKQNGYTTHAVGKWNLGFFKKEYTPTFRGFDTHYGYWQGFHDYYTHMNKASWSTEIGYDFRRNLEVDYDAKGKYSTTLFTNEAVKLIHEHDTNNPMFLYLAHMAPHTGNEGEQLQAPDEEIAKFAHIKDPERRIYAAMVSMLDQSVGTVIAALREKRMLQNSVILFFSDNGAAQFGSSYPLRGKKRSAWEGGNRNLAAIWSPLIQKPQRVSNQLIHIIDWLPTFYSIAGLNKTEISNTDGIDMWESISEDKESPRIEMVYNIDTIRKWGAIRQGDWKYIYGSTGKEKNSWFGNDGKKKEYSYDIDQILTSKTATAFAGLITDQQVKDKNSNRRKRRELKIIDQNDIETLRTQATVTCGPFNFEDQPEENKCNLQLPCLFNIKEDPCERVNLAKSRPNIVRNLEKLLVDYRKNIVPALNADRDPRANPINWNNTWSSWLDSDYIVRSKVPNSFRTISTMNIIIIVVSSIIILFIVFRLSSKLADTKAKKREQKRKAETLLSNNSV
uniref:Glucosinolate sulfatase 3 n=1 Tax=Psylliodes chrysocephalus TaxID=3402493 RepID=A0A384WD78_9CUCU|nr:glucosinolate sulfatase 3 [Psylliodes chrysocephala]